jgi:hypothetical protein
VKNSRNNKWRSHVFLECNSFNSTYMSIWMNILLHTQIQSFHFLFFRHFSSLFFVSVKISSFEMLLGLFRLSWSSGWRSFKFGYCCWVGSPWSSCFRVSIGSGILDGAEGNVGFRFLIKRLKLLYTNLGDYSNIFPN